jgi:hypothetical protein
VLHDLVEKGNDLTAEELHRVVARVPGLIALAVAQQIDEDHSVAALRERIGERVVMFSRQEQPVDQDDRSLACSLSSPALLVRDPELVVVEVRHDRKRIYSDLVGRLDFSADSTSSRLSTLPVDVRGSSSTISIRRGTL